MGSTPGVSESAARTVPAAARNSIRERSRRRTRVLLARDLDLDVGVVRRSATVLVDVDLHLGLLPLGQGDGEALVRDVAQLGVVARAHLHPNPDPVRSARRALGAQAPL